MSGGLALQPAHDIESGGPSKFVNRGREPHCAAFEDRDAFVASGMDHGVREGYERLDEVLAGSAK